MDVNDPHRVRQLGEEKWGTGILWLSIPDIRQFLTATTTRVSTHPVQWQCQFQRWMSTWDSKMHVRWSSSLVPALMNVTNLRMVSQPGDEKRSPRIVLVFLSIPAISETGNKSNDNFSLWWQQGSIRLAQWQCQCQVEIRKCTWGEGSSHGQSARRRKTESKNCITISIDSGYFWNRK